ncbi:Uncharacterized protein LW93_7872 [Fusarium fujikuroi]|nr:Uncharacterized protein LW93_7872 [Fusarium fujikuroi]
MSESVTITEIGECPLTPNCATGEQSTITTTLEPESHWVGYAADPQQGPSEAELDAPVDEETKEYLENFFKKRDLLLYYKAKDASPECSTASSGLDLTCFSRAWPSFCAHVSASDNETLIENVTAKALGSSHKTKRHRHVRLPGMDLRVIRRASKCGGYSIEFSWELGSIGGCVQDCLGAMSKLALSCGLTGSRADGISDSGSLVVSCGICSYRVVEDYQHTTTDTTSDVATATATAESTSSEATTSSSGSTTVTADEATVTKVVTTSEDATSSTEVTETECLKPTDGDHGAIDPGTQDDYAEDFSSQEPDGGWEAGPDIEHTYKETSHGVVYEYKVNWAQGCITDGVTQDIR